MLNFNSLPMWSVYFVLVVPQVVSRREGLVARHTQVLAFANAFVLHHVSGKVMPLEKRFAALVAPEKAVGVCVIFAIPADTFVRGRRICVHPFHVSSQVDFSLVDLFTQITLD